MADDFSGYNKGLTSPATKLRAVTPADGSDLDPIPRALWVGTAGNVAIIAADDSSAVTLSNVPAGAVLSVRAKRVMSTNTTASNIVALS